MTAWVLIWTIFFGGDQWRAGTAVTTHSQEFASKANCEFAMQQLSNTIKSGTLIIGCYPK